MFCEAILSVLQCLFHLKFHNGSSHSIFGKSHDQNIKTVLNAINWSKSLVQE